MQESVGVAAGRHFGTGPARFAAAVASFAGLSVVAKQVIAMSVAYPTCSADPTRGRESERGPERRAVERAERRPEKRGVEREKLANWSIPLVFHAFLASERDDVGKEGCVERGERRRTLEREGNTGVKVRAYLWNGKFHA